MFRNKFKFMFLYDEEGASDAAPSESIPDEGISDPGVGLQGAMNQYLKDPEKGEEEPKPGDPAEEGVDKDPEPPANTLDSMSSEDLISEVKTRDTKVADLIKEQETLNNRIKEFEENGADSDYKKFTEDFKANPKKALKAHAEKLGLPDTDVIETMFKSGSIDDKLAVWQEKILPGIIEKELGLQDGEFEINPADFYTAKTPSNMFLKLSAEKEAELKTELETATKGNKLTPEQLEAFESRAKTGIDEITKTFFDGGQEGETKDIVKANLEADAKTKAMISEMQAIPEKVIKGELDQSRHPFEMTNLLKGTFFDELSDIKANKMVQDVLGQLREKGIMIPADMPTDLTGIKPKAKDPSEKAPAHYSPMAHQMGAAAVNRS